MKTGWNQKPRADRIEDVATEMRKLGTGQSAIAWQRLATLMLEMCEPDARMVKFNDLLLAVVAARLRGRQFHPLPPGKRL